MARWREADNAPGRPSPSRVDSERGVFDLLRAEHSEELWPLIAGHADVRDLLVGPRDRERLWERRAAAEH